MFPSYAPDGAIDFPALERFWRRVWPSAIEIARFWDRLR